MTSFCNIRFQYIVFKRDLSHYILSMIKVSIKGFGVMQNPRLQFI